MFIQGLGHEVLEAESGPDVLDTASATHPALVIMDVQLRGMYGDEVTARLKKTISTRNIPVIINSGWATACNVEERTHRALTSNSPIRDSQKIAGRWTIDSQDKLYFLHNGLDNSTMLSSE